MSLANYLIDRKGESLYENVALLPIANCQHGEISSRVMAIIFNLAPKSPAASASGRSDLITATSCTYEIYGRVLLIRANLWYAQVQVVLLLYTYKRFKRSLDYSVPPFGSSSDRDLVCG